MSRRYWNAGAGAVSQPIGCWSKGIDHIVLQIQIMLTHEKKLREHVKHQYYDIYLQFANLENNRSEGSLFFFFFFNKSSPVQLISSLSGFITDRTKIFLWKKAHKKEEKFFTHLKPELAHTSVLMTLKWQPHQWLIQTTSCLNYGLEPTNETVRGGLFRQVKGPRHQNKECFLKRFLLSKMKQIYPSKCSARQHLKLFFQH